MQFGTFFYVKRKARRDKMFILALIVLQNHAKFRSPKWRLNENFSRKIEKASRIGDPIGCNFEPCKVTERLGVLQSAIFDRVMCVFVTI